jgi:hypothetical protein
MIAILLVLKVTAFNTGLEELKQDQSSLFGAAAQISAQFSYRHE